MLTLHLDFLLLKIVLIQRVDGISTKCSENDFDSTCLPRVFTYTIVDYGVYTSFGYHTFLRPISKSFLTIKYINKHLPYAKFQTDWLETVENRSNSKSISDSGVWCNREKKRVKTLGMNAKRCEFIILGNF